MKQNDVRIGNYVTWKESDDAIILTVIGIEKGGTVWVEWVWGDGTLDSTDCSIENITHIPLTKKWLDRFGFKKRETSAYVEYYIGYNDITHDWLFSLTWLERPETINAPNAPFYRNGKHTIYYVHQLQNLYFALTGEELTELIP